MSHNNDSFQKENATATYPVPDSCCVEKTENCGFEYNEENMIYSEGCIKKIGQFSIFYFVKWGASFRQLSSLICPMRNSDQMIMENTHPTLSDRDIANFVAPGPGPTGIGPLNPDIRQNIVSIHKATSGCEGLARDDHF